MYIYIYIYSRDWWAGKMGQQRSGIWIISYIIYYFFNINFFSLILFYSLGLKGTYFLTFANEII